MCINIRYFSWDTSTSFFFLLKKKIKLYWADRVMYGFKGLLFLGYWAEIGVGCGAQLIFSLQTADC